LYKKRDHVNGARARAQVHPIGPPHTLRNGATRSVSTSLLVGVSFAFSIDSFFSYAVLLYRKRERGKKGVGVKVESGMQYQTPGRRRVAHPNSRSPVLAEDAIVDFCQVIDSTPTEDWPKRVQALEDLVALIPDGSAYLQSPGWYNTPVVLSHLALPVQELLKDARSTVVRRVCTALTTLFNKCQSDARLLFKEIMYTVLHVQGQTVQVIRSAVRTLISEAIPEVPCKSVMPLWMERLKSDKSPAVRDACALYLGLALQHWSSEAGYLTDDIFLQVGQVLLHTLRDPSPTVRQHAKGALIHMVHHHPERYERLIQDPNGPASKDKKLQQWLRSLGSASAVPPDDLSVASKYTYQSESRWATTKAAVHQVARISSPRVFEDEVVASRTPVPFSIAVATAKTSPPAAAVDPLPRRTTAPFSHVVQSPVPVATSPRRRVVPPAAPIGTPPRAPVAATSAAKAPPLPPTPQSQTYTALALQKSNDDDEEEDAALFEYSESNHAEVEEDISPFIASMHELKKHASRRRSRNSLLMVERFRASTSTTIVAKIDEAPTGSSSEMENHPIANTSTVVSKTEEDTSASAKSPHRPPEHIVLAIRLLRAHKSHVDQIMETLKLEMDTLRDFDRLLEEPGRPTEDELLQYYESIDLCLRQRLQANKTLRQEMDRISAGES
jgi:CLASP N terminal